MSARYSHWGRFNAVHLYGCLFVLLSVVCALEPVRGDSWPHYFAARSPITPSEFWNSIGLLHENGNPRWGQIVLMLSFRTSIISVLITPLAIVGMTVCCTTLALGRLPSNKESDDTTMVATVLLLLVVMTPSFGIVWFYRPVCTNYIYPLAVQLAFLIPYRLAAIGTLRGGGVSAIPYCLGMVVLGAIAGAGNEHTGVGLLVGALAFSIVSWRRHRKLYLWMIGGLVGVSIGYYWLLVAPGQMRRYQGAAATPSILDTFLERGFVENLVLFVSIVKWVALPCGLTIFLSKRTKTAPLEKQRLVSFVLVGIGIMFLGVAILSPKIPQRLGVASTTMFATAIAVYMQPLIGRRWLRRSIWILLTVLLGSATAIGIVIGIEGRDRIAVLENAPPGAEVHLTSYTFVSPSPLSWGDDFRSAELVERLGKRMGLSVSWSR